MYEAFNQIETMLPYCTVFTANRPLHNPLLRHGTEPMVKVVDLCVSGRIISKQLRRRDSVIW